MVEKKEIDRAKLEGLLGELRAEREKRDGAIARIKELNAAVVGMINESGRRTIRAGRYSAEVKRRVFHLVNPVMYDDYRGKGLLPEGLIVEREMFLAYVTSADDLVLVGNRFVPSGGRRGGAEHPGNSENGTA